MKIATAKRTNSSKPKTDMVREMMNFLHFDKEKITKVPAELHLSEDGGYMSFNILFEGYDIIAVHLLKSGEWFYGIYYGAHLHGYLYQGEKITLLDQFDLVRRFLPKDRNDLKEKVEEYSGRVDYHTSAAEAFRILGNCKSLGQDVIERINQ